MAIDEKKIKIEYIKHFTGKRLKDYLAEEKVDKSNFYKENIASKKIDALFEKIYQDTINDMKIIELIKSGRYEEVAKILNISEKENK